MDVDFHPFNPRMGGFCHGCGLPPIPPITTTFHPQTTTTPPKAFHPLRPNPRMSLQPQPPTHSHTHPSLPLLSIHKPITNFTHPPQHHTKSQDVALPYLNDPRHADDTLFFILEEDWRLTRHDGFSRAELLQQQRERGEKIVSLSPDCPPPGAATDQSSGEALYHRAALKDDWWRITREMHPAPLPGKAQGKGKKEAKTRQVQAWPLRTTKPSREEFENTSSFLKQLVRLVTAARRSHRGDLVWMCWNGTATKTKTPCHSTPPPCWRSAFEAPSA